MTQVTIGKWGDHLAVRLPGDIAQAAQLHDGERVEIETQGGDIVIRRLESRVALADLFNGRTAEAWRAVYAEAYDWGPDVGHEIVAD